MSNLERFVERAKEFAGRVDFVVVYLEEAHPTNGWLYPSVEHYIAQHTEMPDRVAAATILERRLEELAEERSSEPIRVFVDRMDNAASHAFGALPERIAIVADGRVQFIGGRGPEE